MILALPFIVMRGSAVVRLRPLLFGFWLAFLIGLGGTTPVGRLLLGRAYEVLTMERFSYWATLLALAVCGAAGLRASRSLSHARGDRSDRGGDLHLRLCGGMDHLPAGRRATISRWILPPAWLDRDGHDKYRYVTLGFGRPESRDWPR